MFQPLTIIEAPPDTYGTAIGSLATDDVSTVALTLPSQHTDAAVVASEILRALGKRRDVNGKARHGIDDKMLVPVWLTAHRTQNLIVASPQAVNDRNLADVVELCSATPTNVVIACDPGTRTRVGEALRGYLPQFQAWPDLPARDPQNPQPEPVKWQPGTPVRLPQCEFLNFYATAERTLPPDVFADVSQRYVDALNRTLTWLNDVLAANDDVVRMETINPAMRTLLAEQGTFDHVSTVLHAAQAAFFRTGWMLKIDHRELRSTLTRYPSPEIPTDAWKRLRAYREPARASAVVLNLLGFTIDEIEHITTGDVAIWHANPDQPLLDRHIPDEAAPILRAHLLARATIGHAHHDAFLPKTTKRRIALDLREASTDLDLVLADGNQHRHARHGEQRVSSKAFTVERIA